MVGLGLAIAVLIFLVGGSLGSFVNVVAYRLPMGMSLVRPASRCPACETPIKPWHNVPVLGWLWIRGRCAACGAPVSPRYPLVELVLGVIAVALLHSFAGGWVEREVFLADGFLLTVLFPTVLYTFFAALLMAIALIDLDHFAVYDVTTYPFIPVGVLCAYAFGPAIGIDWMDAIVGAAAGGGVLLMITVLYPLIRGKQGMGWGDWHVMALIGAWLGWEGIPFILWAASLQGILFALMPRLGFGVDEVPPLPQGEEALVSGGGADEAPSVEGDTEDDDGEAVTSWAGRSVPFATLMALAAWEYLLFRDVLRLWLDKLVSALAW